MKKIAAIILLITWHKSFAQLSFSSLGIKLTHSIHANPIQDQSMSSTCWSFASTSFIESEWMRKTNQPVKLSEMFFARCSYINKIKQYLLQKGKIFFTPGGQFHDVLKVIQEYGILPEEVYNGYLHLNYYNHNQLDSDMIHIADKLLAEGKNRVGTQDLVMINQVLDTYIGKVPEAFLYQGKSYTALTFAKKFLHFNTSDYVEITSYIHHPMYQPYVLEDKYNWSFDKYYNVTVNDFDHITSHALQLGYSVEWDGDVEEPGFKYENGIAYLPYEVIDFPKERQVTYDNKSTSLDHMMHIIGTATDKSNNRWFYVKNSWGSTNGLGGYLYMRDDYFKIKTVAIIVNKNAIPMDIRKKLKL